MMLGAIRIKGRIDISAKNKKTFDLLRLRKKFACSIYNPTKENKGMLHRVRNYVAYGEIDEKTLRELVLKRGRLKGNKPINKNKITNQTIKEIFEGKKTLKDLGIKPFFRLHPPRGGFKKSTKKGYPKGVLGNQEKEINKLILRML